MAIGPIQLLVIGFNHPDFHGQILEEIQSGSFAKEWMLENQANRPVFNALTRRGEEHPIEEVGRRLRALMPWMSKGRLVDKTKN